MSGENSCSPYTIKWAKDIKSWEVGFVQFGEFQRIPLADFYDFHRAYAFINYLNGGTGEPFKGGIDG